MLLPQHTVVLASWPAQAQTTGLSEKGRQAAREGGEGETYTHDGEGPGARLLAATPLSLEKTALLVFSLLRNQLIDQTLGYLTQKLIVSGLYRFVTIRNLRTEDNPLPE